MEEIREQSNELMAIASLLMYPSHQDFVTTLSDIEQYAMETQNELLRLAAHGLSQFHTSELEQHYVNTFDFQEKTSLYLTAHEWGDGRERGQALLELQQSLMKHGFEIASGELPDYIPLLLEFLAAEPSFEQADSLRHRLANVCQHIHDTLDRSHPYRAVFSVLLAQLPKLSTYEQSKMEAPDLEDLPYPVFYD